MPNIPVINIGGTDYNVKDAQARSDLDSKTLIYKRSLGEENLDEFTEPGIFYVTLAAIGGTLPDDLSEKNGGALLQVFGTGYYATQILFAFSYGKAYIRSMKNVSQHRWNAWSNNINAGNDQYIKSLDPNADNIDTLTKHGVFYGTIEQIPGTYPSLYTGRYLLSSQGIGNYLYQILIDIDHGKMAFRGCEPVSGERKFTPWRNVCFENGTRNIWPFGSSETFSNYVILGDENTDALPAGTYFLTFNVQSTKKTSLIVYSSARAVASKQFNAGSDLKYISISSEDPIRRFFFESTDNEEVTVSNIQLEVVDWQGYKGSPSPSEMSAMPYGTPLIGRQCAVDLVAREYPSNWEGKSIVFNGDSVTQAGGSNGYVKVVCQLLRFGKVRNYAIGGTRFARCEDSPNALVDRYTDMNLDADIVFIMANTNDYASQVPLGAADSHDPETYNGALNVVMDWLKQSYPTQPIIISTMLTRKINYDPETSQPLPITIEQYAECVRQRTLEHHFILYDAFTLSGLDLLNSPKDGTGITNDGLHPNEAGELSLGRKIAAFINAQ